MSEDNAVSSMTGEDCSKVAAFLGVNEGKVRELDAWVVSVIVSKVGAFNQLKAENTRLSISIDGQKCNFEKTVGSLKERLEKLRSEAERCEEENGKVQDRYQKLLDTNSQVNSELHRMQTTLEETRHQLDSANSAKQNIALLLEEKVTELEASKEDTKQVLEQNRELRKNALDLEMVVQSHKSESLRDRATIQRLEQELGLVKSNNEWLSSELEAKTSQLNSLRERSNAELRSNSEHLNNLQNDLEIVKSTNVHLKSKLEELSAKLHDTLAEKKQLMDSSKAEQEEFTREMTLKQRLTELLEGQLERLKADYHKVCDLNKEGTFSNSERERLLDELIDTKRNLETANAEVLKLEETIQELLEAKDEVSSTNSKLNGVNGLVEVNTHTVSKLHGDIGILKKQLIQERRQKEQLRNQVESFVVELEHKIPVLNTFKERTEMLEKELNEVTLLLESTARDRDQKTIELKQVQNKVSSYESQVCSLQKQRSDLAHQVQFLLVQVSVRGDSQGPLSKQEFDFVKKILAGEEKVTESDTQMIISERLLRFKSIVELQQRNAELLNSIRQLADKLEEQEKKTSSRAKEVENATICEARDVILSLQEHSKVLENQLTIITKERDALKLLKANNEYSEKADTLNRIDMSQDIADMKAHMQSLTVESERHIKLLNDEIKSLYKSKSEISVNLEKERSSRILAEERLKIIQTTLEMTKAENSQLQEKSSQLQMMLFKHEETAKSTLDEIISTKSQLCTLHSQLGVLEAERNFLRGVEQELKKENESSTAQVAELKVLVSQLQTLQRERDNILEESQKNHKSIVEKLETEIEVLNCKLENKVKEFEEQKSVDSSQYKWFQHKIDSLNESLESARNQMQEKSAFVETLLSQLGLLNKQLQEASVKLESYDLLTNSDDGSENLNALRMNLEKANINLADAYSQIEQYKAISQASEESVTEISKALEQSQSGYSQRIHALEAERSSLKAEVQQLKDQVQNLTDELAQQKSKHEAEKSEVMKTVSTLEGSHRDMDVLKSEYDSKLDELQKDLLQQVEFAKQAKTALDNELQKQATANETISSLREECVRYKSELEHSQLSKVEIATELSRLEESWQNEKRVLEEQLDLAQQQAAELKTQNKLLYDQIELLSKSSSLEIDTEEAPAEARELIMALRRERDVLEMKLEVSTSEERVLRQRLDLLGAELTTLKMEKSKSEAITSSNELITQNQEEIMEKLNQLNLLREANATLRTESRKYMEANTELENEISALREKFQPLEARLQSLQQGLEERDQQIQLLKEDSSRWKQRSQDILQKYERIDPAEHQKLVEECSMFKKELEQKSIECQESQERFKKLRKQATERLDEFKAAKVKAESNLEAINMAKAQLESDLMEALAKIDVLEASLSSLSAGSGNEALNPEFEETKAKLAETEEKLASVLSETTSSEAALKSQIEDLNNQVNSLKQELRSAVEELENTKKASLGSTSPEHVTSNEAELAQKVSDQEQELALLRKLKEENEALQTEVSALKATVSEASDSNPSNVQWEEEHERKTLERIREAEEALKKRIRLPSEEKINQVIEKHKKSLDDEFASRVQLRARELCKENPDALLGDKAQLISDHKAELEKLKAEFRDQLEQVRKKALEEGKQQLSMKVKLLESKISKLEAKTPKGNLGPSKIELDNNNSQKVTQAIPIKPSPFQIAFNNAMGNAANNPFRTKQLDLKTNTFDAGKDASVGSKRQSEDELVHSPEKKAKED